MADIAFLLLIFFLLATTMDVEKGLMATLPPLEDPALPAAPPQEVLPQNALEITILADNTLQVEKSTLMIEQLQEYTENFFNNYGTDPRLSEHPTKGVIALTVDKNSTYQTYIEVQNALKLAVDNLRNNWSTKTYGQPYLNMPEAEQKKARDLFPLKISETQLP